MRFSIRDLLWLTVLAAVAVAWWLDHKRLTAENAAIVGESKLRRVIVYLGGGVSGEVPQRTAKAESLPNK